jgi:hypothetical protein
MKKLLLFLIIAIIFVSCETKTKDLDDNIDTQNQVEELKPIMVQLTLFYPNQTIKQFLVKEDDVIGNSGYVRFKYEGENYYYNGVYEYIKLK